MKIAHLVPTLHPGGPEIGLVDLAAGARELDPESSFEMVVVALASTSDTTQVSALRRLGVPVAELGVGPWDPRAVVRTARLLRERGVDLVHTHLPPADVVGAAAAARNRIPAVSTLHRVENDPADRGDRLKRSAKILARQRFMSRTLAISRTQLQWYRGLAGPDPTVVLEPNGVVDPGPADPAVRARRRAALEVDDGDVVVLAAEPMRREGGHALLFDALEALPDGVPVVVALAGDGPLRPWLEARADASDELGARVRFVHRAQAPAELLAAADLAVYSAATGALPTALLRAMAAGLPVVGTRVGGVPEIVTAGTGVLVPLSATALADALARLADDGEGRAAMGRAARARYLATYSATGWAARLHAVYADVLNDRAAAAG
ncbi:glycosyltransferase [Pseudonocardia sp. CA-107938]|uniref:glycosyltransferase n=1 Tax=Pseudonocardia sp. CA-107938 TaxID=3240021 RepID=UPI003D89B467